MSIFHEKLAPYFRTLSSTPCKTPTNVQCGHEYILLKKDINKDNSFILTKCVQVIFSILLFSGNMSLSKEEEYGSLNGSTPAASYFFLVRTSLSVHILAT